MIIRPPPLAQTSRSGDHAPRTHASDSSGLKRRALPLVPMAPTFGRIPYEVHGEGLSCVLHRASANRLVFFVEQSGNDSELGNRIREAREKAGLSQQAMAAKLDGMGIPEASFGSYRRYETGEKSPSAAILRGIASIADARVQELLSAEVVDSPTFPTDVPPDGLQILGHIEAELMRQEEEGAEGGPQKVFEIVERRVQRLLGEGRIDDAGYAYWRALRRGAMLAGGYEPENADPENAALGDCAQRDIA